MMRIDFDFVRALCAQRPTPAESYDQLPATAETLIRRVRLVAQQGWAPGARIVFIGDDDFASIVVARYLAPERVLVLDIDERIVHALQTLSDKWSLGLQIEVYDVLAPLPGQHQGAFDLCLMDPPYTTAGFDVFMARGVATLSEGRGKRIISALSREDVGREGWQRCLKAAESRGLRLERVLHDFNRYDLGLRPWETSKTSGEFRSALLVFESIVGHQKSSLVAVPPREELYAYD